MASKFLKSWGNIKARLQRIGLGISGVFYHIIDIPAYEDNLGYTRNGNAIYLAPNHPIMNGLSDEERYAFVQGVFAHELMHQLNTDFAAFEAALDKLPLFQRKIFQLVFNVMEDPAIEYWAKEFFEGSMLRSLHFSVNYIYKNQEDIDPKSSPFDQFIMATIQYGDGGLLKGDFGSELAEECFFKALPILDKAIEESNGAKRVQYAQEVFKMIIPLWIDMVKNAEEFKKFMDNLMKSLESAGKTFEDFESGSGGAPLGGQIPEGSSGEDPTSEKKKKRRKITFKKISKEEADKMASEATEGTPDPDGDLTVFLVEDDDSKEQGDKGDGDGIGSNSDSKADETEEDTESQDGTQDGSKEGTEADNGDSESGADKSDLDSAGESTEDQTREYTSDVMDQSEKLTRPKEGSKIKGGNTNEEEDIEHAGLDTIDEQEYELSSDDIKAIREDLNNILEEIKAERKETEEALNENLDIPEMSEKYRGVRCLNLAVKANTSDLESMYSELLNLLSPGINNLTNQLKRIFRNDQEQRDYRASGRVNVKRLQSNRMTSKVFDRRIEPNNKSNIAVMLVVDVSASMRGYKELMAKQAAVGLAEVFAKIGVNLKVMTFNADCQGNDAVHMHYVNWHNTHNERVKLLNIAARSSNFDGYSIRYAGKLIKKRPEEHKLMIVISDGRPACSYYRGDGKGIADTRDAIKEASKYATVIGVAIDADANILQSMYGAKFIHITDINHLFEQLGNKIKKEIKSW